jgi:hypothetical protein
MNVEEAKLLERIASLLEAIATQKRACKLCGETCYWVRARDGATVYVLNADLTRHRETCPRAPLLAPVKARQERLFAPDARAALDPQR